MDRPSKFITFEERQKIEELLKKNLSTRKIAKVLGRSKYCIGYELKRMGGLPNYNAISAQENAQSNLKSRGQKLKKCWSEEIEKIIMFEIANRKNLTDIALELRINRSTLMRWLKERNIDYAKCVDRSSYEQRISSLEMQVEIILEQLEKLNDKITFNKKL